MLCCWFVLCDVNTWRPDRLVFHRSAVLFLGVLRESLLCVFCFLLILDNISRTMFVFLSLLEIYKSDQWEQREREGCKIL